MSDDKQKNEGEGLYQSQWHKCPNGMIDCIAGIELKPGALVVAMTIIRYTVGMGGKKSAAIPTEVFMRVLGTNREKTAYEHVRQAVESGLVQVIKKQGCISVYSINQDSDLWHKAPVVAESASSSEKCHIGSGGKRHKVVAESATGVVAESATLIKTTKENYKDNIKDSDEKASCERNVNASETHGGRNANHQSSTNINTQKWRDDRFEEFYELYPNKKSKGQAKTTWNHVFRGNKVHNKPESPELLFKQIMQGVGLQTPKILASEESYRKHPSTWLNAQAWLDEVVPQQTQSPASRTRSTPDPLAVNAKWNVPMQMTDEQKRQWLAGEVDSDIPSSFMEGKQS